MMFKKCKESLPMVAITLLISNCVSIAVGLQNSFNTLQTDQQNSQPEKNYKSLVTMPKLKSNVTMQCNSKKYINNFVLSNFALAFAQTAEEMPELRKIFTLVNFPKDDVLMAYKESWKYLLSRYGITHANDISKSLSKTVSSAYGGVTPEEVQCGIGMAYGLPLLNTGVLTAQNSNILAIKLANFIANAIQKANPSDVQDIFKRFLEGVEVFLKMSGINMVEELPKIFLSNVYMVKFYGNH